MLQGFDFRCLVIVFGLSGDRALFVAAPSEIPMASAWKGWRCRNLVKVEGSLA